MSQLPQILWTLLTTFTVGAGFGFQIWNVSVSPSASPAVTGFVSGEGSPPPFFVASPERLELFHRLVSLEPTVREVQKAALRYGNLGNGKILRWHTGSRLRALIPRVTFGKDLTLASQVDIDRGGTSTPDQFITGPDETKRGWDLNFTWDLGDLFWSTAQTTIDTRMRSLVDLRRPLLNEVTRVYFERRSVQTGLVLAPPSQDFSERMALLLRLDELSAQLDALTNGYFSQEIQKIFTRYPELSALYSLLNPNEWGAA